MSPLAIFRDVLAAYRRHWRILLGAAFLLFGAFNAFELLVPEVESDHLGAQVLIEAIFLGAGSFAISSYEEAFFEGVVASAAAEWRMGRPRPSLLTVARSVPYLVLIAVNAVIAVGTSLGLLLLIVPGVLFGTYTALAPALTKIEHLGVRAALRRSFQLVNGNLWSVFVLIWGVYLATEAATAGLDQLLHGVGLEYLTTTAAEALLAPLYGLAAVLVTYDLIARRASTPPPGGAPGS
jgi:hypothetical protein